MSKTPTEQELVNLFANPLWRLENLYYIVNKQGQKVKFKLNWAQRQLYQDTWYCNIILKARQLGISTYVSILFLDRCLWGKDQAAGIIAHTLEDSQQLFKRVKYAYDNLPEDLKKLISAETDTTNMLKFSNGSSIRVGTSLRSSTFQYLHISEFGKICAKYPDKAQEIITGSLNTVAPGQYVFIESTAEGREGYFYDLCKRAQEMQQSKAKLSKLDFKFHFYPWYKEPSYRIGNTPTITPDLQEYFDHLAGLGIELDNEQRAWYCARAVTQQDDMRREYPSTPGEAWEVTNEGLYYCKQLNLARADGRVGKVPWDETLEVHSAWDLGYNDSTAIWLFQVFKKEIRLIEYIEGSGESLAHWISVLKSRDYAYGKHIAPHDITVHEYSSGMTRQSTARKLGINFIPAQRVEIIPGIDKCRAILSRCWFDERLCARGLQALDNYKKDWDERLGTWRSKPCHNAASHGADAFRTLATGLHYVENQYNSSVTHGHNPTDYLRNKYQITR